MITPKISVIVPVYGVEAYLNRCVQSILAQDFTDYELILVDDGSPDHCPEMCDSYAKRDERIKVVHKENGGLTSARLAGFEISQGEYISFLDSDDHIAVDTLSVLYKSIKESDADLAICGWFTETSNKGIVTHTLPLHNDLLGKETIVENYCLPLIGSLQGDQDMPGFMCLRLFSRRHIQQEMFVSEREYMTEDILFNLMYGLKIEKIAVVNQPLYYYCVNGTSLTQKYRVGVFQKLLARYEFCLSLCQQNGLEDRAKKRLLYNLLSAAAFSVLNACKLSDFKSARHEIKEIFRDARIKNMFATLSRKGFSVQYRIIYWGYRTHAYRFMYHFFRWRMGI